MKQRTIQDCIDDVHALQKTLKEQYGLCFGGKCKDSTCVISTESARITFFRWVTRTETGLQTTRAALITMEQLTQLLAEEFPMLKYEPIDGLYEFGVMIYFNAEKYLRVAFVQHLTDDPAPIYVWYEDDTKLTYTHSSLYDRSCHYTVKKTDSDIFNTAAEALQSLKERLTTEKERLERLIAAAQQKVAICTARLAELEAR